ncbi:MAG: hypothetical protein M0P99_06895 [Candidatus Cloacimonetes bacterium]|nr:hypothetical protein [Candidatus Cloacimonadota bacterium]
MRFYYENSLGDNGYFSEKDLVKAIYTVWNIEANLYLLDDGIKKIDWKSFNQQAKLIFAPYEENEFNTEILEEYGYKMEDVGKEREIIDIKTGEVVKYDWSEVKQLI